MRHRRQKIDAILITLAIIDIILAIFTFVLPFLFGIAIASTTATSLMFIVRVSKIKNISKKILTLRENTFFTKGYCAHQVRIKCRGYPEKESKMKKTKLKKFLSFIFVSNPATFFAGLVGVALLVANSASGNVIVDAALGWIDDDIAITTMFYSIVGGLGVFGVVRGGLRSNTTYERCKEEKRQAKEKFRQECELERQAEQMLHEELMQRKAEIIAKLQEAKETTDQTAKTTWL